MMELAGIRTRFFEKWQPLNQTQKIASVVLTVSILACLVFVGHALTRPTYAPLFTGLEPADAGAIVEKLKGMKVPYQVADDGRTIKVPNKDVYEARIQLASSGVLAGSGTGFELFDHSKFGQTDFEQQVGYQRALQEELRRTVVQLDSVEQARVHLVIPQKSVFVGDQGTASASVALKLRPSARLKPEQVQGIRDIFVGSVEGLRPENVHIIDTEGNILSDNIKADDRQAGLSRMALEQQQARKEYERELEARVHQMLARIVGYDASGNVNAVAMVTAELDFDQQQTVSTTAANPDNLRVSEHTVSESGNGSGVGGAAGTDSNIITTPFIQQTGSSDYKREESIINYQVSTTQETLVKAPGSVKRLSAAVVLKEREPFVDTEGVREAVAAAIGYNQERGDQISVSNMYFDTSYQDEVRREMIAAQEQARERESQFRLILLGASLLVIIVAVVVMLVRRRRAAERVDELFEEEIPVAEKMVPVIFDKVELSQEEQERQEKQKLLREMAKERPREVADILKVWIKE